MVPPLQIALTLLQRNIPYVAFATVAQPLYPDGSNRLLSHENFAAIPLFPFASAKSSLVPAEQWPDWFPTPPYIREKNEGLVRLLRSGVQDDVSAVLSDVFWERLLARTIPFRPFKHFRHFHWRLARTSLGLSLLFPQHEQCGHEQTENRQLDRLRHGRSDPAAHPQQMKKDCQVQKDRSQILRFQLRHTSSSLLPKNSREAAALAPQESVLDTFFRSAAAQPFPCRQGFPPCPATPAAYAAAPHSSE